MRTRSLKAMRGCRQSSFFAQSAPPRYYLLHEIGRHECYFFSPLPGGSFSTISLLNPVVSTIIAASIPFCFRFAAISSAFFSMPFSMPCSMPCCTPCSRPWLNPSLSPISPRWSHGPSSSPPRSASSLRHAMGQTPGIYDGGWLRPGVSPRLCSGSASSQSMKRLLVPQVRQHHYGEWVPAHLELIDALTGITHWQNQKKLLQGRVFQARRT